VIVVADVDAGRADEVRREIEGQGGQASVVPTDVTQREAVEALVADTVSAHGRLDFMFNNAGIAINGEFRDMTFDLWERIVAINFFGVLYGTDAAYRVMIEQGAGHIVNTTSMMGVLVSPMTAAYTATKHAVVGMTLSLRPEAAGLGVRVSVVCPGMVKTPLYDTIVSLKVSRADMLRVSPFKMITASQAARSILRGVERNQEIIIFPLHARLMWWLRRINPTILSPLVRRVVRDIRARRVEGS
jgi:NAD(P)-dependent dehydrogenase (short-subunit alcohol dehydrogenase family)